MSYIYVSREDFESWVELVEGDQNGPDYSSADIRVSGKLSNGVEFRLNATAIQSIPATSEHRAQRFYGRGDGYDSRHQDEPKNWNMVRVPTYQGTAFNHMGKGSRSVETWKESQDLLNLLTGSNEQVQGW